MEFEDEVEQSLGRPCRRTDGGAKLTFGSVLPTLFSHNACSKDVRFGQELALKQVHPSCWSASPKSAEVLLHHIHMREAEWL